MSIIRLAALAAGACIVATATPASAQQAREYHIPAGNLRSALDAYASQSGQQIIYRADDVSRARSPGVQGTYGPKEALQVLLKGSGFSFRLDSSGAIAILASGKEPASASEGQADDIVVVGTNIKGNVNRTVPVISYSRDQIEQSGQGTTQDLLATLPQNYAGGGSEGASETGLYGHGADREVNVARQSGVNLRGLNSRATLTLINGHRVAPADQGLVSADISMIPLSAVERIDVLTDGASAIYGADAIAGVVNVVLRKKYDGVETSMRVGGSTDGASQEYRLSQFGGKSWDGGSLFLAGEYYNRPNMLEKDRPNIIDQVPGDADILPDVQRTSLMGHLQTQLTPSLNFFVDGLYSRTDSDYVSGAANLAATFDTRSTQYNLVSGLEYDLGGTWFVTADGALGKSQVKETDIAFDLDGILVNGGNSQADEWSRLLELQASGSLFALPGGDVKLALGASHQWSSFKQNVLYYDLETYEPISRETERQVSSAYGELSIPLTNEAMALPGLRTLDLSAAARFDHYSDFGDTFNPKLGIAWSPISDLHLRASYSTSFRAPSSFERVFEGYSTSNLFIYPFTAPGGGSQIPVLVVSGSKDLKAEKSTNYSVGGSFEPSFAPGLKLSVDWYRISYRDQIDNPPLSRSALNNPLLAPFIVDLTAPGAAEEYAKQFLDHGGLLLTPFPGYDSLADVQYAYDYRKQNMAVVDIDGIDINASYAFDIGDSRFALRADVAHIAHIRTRLAEDSAAFDRVDTLGEPVDWRGRGSLNWSKGPWTATTSVNYVDSYVDESGTSPIKVPSFTTFDLSASANLEKLFHGGIFKGLRARASVLNLFDAKPPYVVNTPSRAHFDSAYYDVRGRFAAFELTKAW